MQRHPRAWRKLGGELYRHAAALGGVYGLIRPTSSTTVLREWRSEGL